MEKSGDKSGFLSLTPDILLMMPKITTIITATFAVFYPDLEIFFNDTLTSEINNYSIIHSKLKKRLYQHTIIFHSLIRK